MNVLRRWLRDLYHATEAYNKEALLGLARPIEGGRMLDCGCGDGSFTRALADRAGVAEVHGIEAQEERVRSAEARGIVVSQVDLNQRLPFDDGFFDLVHSNQLIEHLSNTDFFLRELYRVLSPTGYVLLSTNNLASWHNLLSLVLGMQPPPMHASNEVIVGNWLDPFRGHRFDASEDTHLRIFSFQALKDLCKYHGFDVEVIRSTGYYPFPPFLARLFTFLDPRHGVYLVCRLGR